MPNGPFSTSDSRASELAAIGARYQVQGNIDAARLHYDAALLLEPDHPIALQNLSGLLFNIDRDTAAASIARRAIAAAPQNLYARANYGAALMHLGEYGEARRELETVLRVVDKDAGIWHNYALLRYMMGDVEIGIRALNRSLELRPATEGDPRSGDLGLFILAQNFLKGLDAYECRWETLSKSRAWDLSVPEWRGEDIHNKRLLFHHEQGFGDSIMLMRFARNLINLGAELTIAVPKELMRLVERGLTPRVAVIDLNSDYASSFDFHVPMLSAPRWLNINEHDIDSAPYLHTDRWEDSLGPDGFRIGICWRSGSVDPRLRRRWRVAPLELFFQLAEIPGVRLVSLQKGEAQKDILNLGAESFIFDPMAAVEDFYDTARIISTLDLVVSVDSAVVHLTGALGKPTFMLGPHTRCWRWWNQPSGLPWYEDFQIFPQDNIHDWGAPLENARRTVENHIQTRKAAA